MEQPLGHGVGQQSRRPQLTINTQATLGQHAGHTEDQFNTEAMLQPMSSKALHAVDLQTSPGLTPTTPFRQWSCASSTHSRGENNREEVFQRQTSDASVIMREVLPEEARTGGGKDRRKLAKLVPEAQNAMSQTKPELGLAPKGIEVLPSFSDSIRTYGCPPAENAVQSGMRPIEVVGQSSSEAHVYEGSGLLRRNRPLHTL